MDSVATDQIQAHMRSLIKELHFSSNLLNRIDASGSIDDVSQKIDEVIDQIVDRKKQKEQLLRSTIQTVLIREEEIEAEKQRVLKEQEEAAKKAEEEAAKGENEVADDQKSVQDKGDKTGRSAVNSKQSQRDKGEASQLTTSSDMVPERNNIDEDFKPVLMELWKKISTTFRSQMVKVLGK